MKEIKQNSFSENTETYFHLLWFFSKAKKWAQNKF